ncbi:Aliphatic sulfonates import ATP-binding protein SsuB [Calidithermus terrae]|uniref:Aliphatic sulfonates import ATP-binding protein SsuB n=1 Tax=Calidithermus terrae TaxID=1408545 RepID=A0A399ELL1_9DEIN|nr:ABC transporter ATP-binding protein [Calidithermus terrae]RIH84363.1 Aliphatic sulfonates import ATP-binding protein SsuB [Calidithermus terrae]
MLARLEAVTKRYGGREGLHDVSLELPQGQAVGLLGLNGAGKTTLLKLLAGLLAPSQGRVEVLGGRPRAMRDHVAYLSDAETYPWLSPADGERLMGGLYPDFNRARYRELLGFLEVPSRPSRALSRGQKARLRLAMALAREARLFLLDEPLAGIDVISRDRILKTLVRQWREDATLVLSTHEVAEAEGIFDRAVFLKDGRVVLDAGAEELRARGKSVRETFVEVLA